MLSQHNSLLFTALSLLAVTSGVSGKTVLETIRENPDLSNFALALSKGGLDALLSDPTKLYTVFAPSNAGLLSDADFRTYIDTDGWEPHLKANCESMIVEGQVLTEAQIFNQQMTDLTSLGGNLKISQTFSTVQLVGMSQSDISADNGIVHVMAAVIKPQWRLETLRNMGVHEELTEQLVPIIDRIQFNDPLTTFVADGTTWVAARNRAYATTDVTLGGDPEKVAELQDPNNVEYTWDTYLYNLIDQNFYGVDVEPGEQILVLPRNPVAHMWVTRDIDKQILRFNDAMLDREYLTTNGVGQIVTKVLVPPGLIELMEITGEYTSINMKQINQLFRSSAWNRRDMAKSVGTGVGSFNVFIPLEGGFGKFNQEDLTRLSTLEWERHLWNFLEHLMFEPAMTLDELTEKVKANGGVMSQKMLSSFNVTFVIDEATGELTIDGSNQRGRFMRPTNMKGVDGLIHIVSECPLPPSVLYSVYDQTRSNPLMEIQANFIDLVKLGVFIDTLLPVTMFTAPNWAWNIQILDTEVEDVLKNHIFRGLFFDDVLAKMNGQTIQSVNGKNWLVEVWNGVTYISNVDGVPGMTNTTFMPGPNSTNILARTGVINHIETIMIDREFPVTAPTPTNAPFAAAAPVVAGAPVPIGTITSGSPIPPSQSPTPPPDASAAVPLIDAARVLFGVGAVFAALLL